jgi:hypothetical protein
MLVDRLADAAPPDAVLTHEAGLLMLFSLVLLQMQVVDCDDNEVDDHPCSNEQLLLYVATVLKCSNHIPRHPQQLLASIAIFYCTLQSTAFDGHIEAPEAPEVQAVLEYCCCLQDTTDVQQWLAKFYNCCHDGMHYKIHVGCLSLAGQAAHLPFILCITFAIVMKGTLKAIGFSSP